MILLCGIQGFLVHWLTTLPLVWLLHFFWNSLIPCLSKFLNALLQTVGNDTLGAVCHLGGSHHALVNLVHCHCWHGIPWLVPDPIPAHALGHKISPQRLAVIGLVVVKPSMTCAEWAFVLAALWPQHLLQLGLEQFLDPVGLDHCGHPHRLHWGLLHCVLVGSFLLGMSGPIHCPLHPLFHNQDGQSLGGLALLQSKQSCRELLQFWR